MSDLIKFITQWSFPLSVCLHSKKITFPPHHFIFLKILDVTWRKFGKIVIKILFFLFDYKHFYFYKLFSKKWHLVEVSKMKHIQTKFCWRIMRILICIWRMFRWYKDDFYAHFIKHFKIIISKLVVISSFSLKLVLSTFALSAHSRILMGRKI